MEKGVTTTGQNLRVAAYRFRPTFGRRYASYVTLAVLVGLLGGVAMASLAAARRTQASYSVYLANTNPSDLGAFTGVANPALGSGSGYNAKFVRAISRLPLVDALATIEGINVLPLSRTGTPVNDPYIPAAAGNGEGSIDRDLFDQDRLSVLQGRMFDPKRLDEIVMLAGSAEALRLRVGDTVRLGFYTNAQTQLPGFGTAAVPPFRRLDARLVGIVTTSATVIADDVDSSVSELAYFSPTLTRQLLTCCVNYSGVGVKVDGGPAAVARVQAEIARVLPLGFPFTETTASMEAKATRALRPEAIALDVFGFIAALATLMIAGQLIARAIRIGAEDATTLRQLGAGPVAVAADQLGGILAAVVVGSLLASAFAVALSPLSPFGPVRAVYPTPGAAFDWAVLGLGTAAFMVILSLVALTMAYRWAPHRLARQMPLRAGHRSNVAMAATSSGLPIAVATGIRLALEPGTGRNAVPVRSATFGAVLALIVVTGTVTFGASLDTLVSTPRLYGWNWDYALASGGDIPAREAAHLLDRQHVVARWAGYSYGTLALDGQSVPILGGRPGAGIQPPVLSGHGLQNSSQVVLGALTLADLHKRIGDTLSVSDGKHAIRTLTIVGTATLPTIGNQGEEHLEMGSGAFIDSALIPTLQTNPFADPIPGPEVIFVDVRSGASRGAAIRSLREDARALSNTANFGVALQTTALRPAEIVNYRSVGTTPAILGACLAAGAVSALMLTLVASVRRRRREMAMLKTLGFTGRQLASSVAWQAVIAVGIGTLIGVPLGVVFGRWLWDLFAEQIQAVPAPTVPLMDISAICLGALLLALLVSAVPRRIAARTPTALLLRAE
jgi:hypothetical protein